MKNLSMFVALMLLLSAVPAFAQDGPPPPPNDQGGPGMRGPGGPGGGFGGGGPGMRPPPPDMQKFEMLRGYLDLVDHFARLSRDSTAAGVAAVVSANDLLRQRGGADAAIDYFNKMLPQVKDEAVQRTIRIELIDLYKQSGQTDKAIEQLTLLMTSATGSNGMTQPHTP
ncbi:MAG TPA: hypothetical protein VKK61_00580 [Tepidisphaeraceae bacterium]|nr:hypothetical protein [Tepidisphaeraceae bacterium]